MIWKVWDRSSRSAMSCPLKRLSCPDWQRVTTLAVIAAVTSIKRTEFRFWLGPQ